MQELIHKTNAKLGNRFDFKLSEDVNNNDKMKFIKGFITDSLSNYILMNVALYFAISIVTVIFLAIKKHDKLYIPFIEYSIGFITINIISYNKFKYIHHIVNNRKINIHMFTQKLNHDYIHGYKLTLIETVCANTTFIPLAEAEIVEEEEECKL